MAPFPSATLLPAGAAGAWVVAVRIATASVWLAFGLLFKLLGLVPRHRAIVAAVVGEAAAGPLTFAVGAAEVLLAAWVLSGWRPRLCMSAQTVALAAMNALELLAARDLLLAPIPMLLGNAALLGAGWWAALQARPRPAAPS
jgi:hypothetical protein